MPQRGPSGPSHVPSPPSSPDARPIGAPPTPASTAGRGVPPPRYSGRGGGGQGGSDGPTGHLPKRRDPGEDPSAMRRDRPWIVWGLLGLVGVVVLALVIGMAVRAGDPQSGLADVTPQPPATVPTANPSSTLQTASPVVPQPGAVIPITSDISFPDGMTMVLPSVGDWEQSVQERQPEDFIIEDTKSSAYLAVLALPQLASTYRDEDLTRADLNSSAAMFSSGKLSGEPYPFNISGSGYTVEFLAQRIAFDSYSSEEAIVISRVMPGANLRVQIVLYASATEINDPNSRLHQKLKELTFTVP